MSIIQSIKSSVWHRSQIYTNNIAITRLFISECGTESGKSFTKIMHHQLNQMYKHVQV